jgi:hypothetical protein
MSGPRIGSIAAAIVLLAASAISSCASTGRFLGDLLRERPPAALDSMSIASDLRVDSLGYLVGSFVGEGTSRSVHLLSSDTALIAGLVRRYRPDLARPDIWASLSRERVVSLAPGGRRRTVAGYPGVDRALVGSPVGHTRVTPSAILIRGSSCGWRGAQVEVIADGNRQPLHGPVLASFTRGAAAANEAADEEFRRREPVPSPGSGLLDELIDRTAAAMDSVLAANYQSLALEPAAASALEINTLADIDAADVTSYRADPGTVRYAVSLRTRRITGGGDTLVAATVMTWDSAGAWHQTIFRPTLVSLSRGRLGPYGALRRSLFWRRLQPISDFAFQRDNLWMEQVDVRRGSVLWGIIQPRGNVVVAAAEVDASCR